MSVHPAIARALKSSSLDESTLETVTTIDGEPLLALRAPSDASIEMLEKLRAPDLQAFVLGDDLDRWREVLREEQTQNVEGILARAAKLQAELARVDDELDLAPPPRHDFQSVLVASTKHRDVFTSSTLRAALANAPQIESKKKPLPAYDEEARVDAAFPVIADRWIALIPARTAHEPIARLRFGNFSACPPTSVHVAVLRRWESSFGASLLLLAPDELVLSIARPPTTPREIHVATLEQLWLGGDDRPTPGETKGNVWRWWWD